MSLGDTGLTQVEQIRADAVDLLSTMDHLVSSILTQQSGFHPAPHPLAAGYNLTSPSGFLSMLRNSSPSQGSPSSSRKRKYSCDSTSGLNSVDMPQVDLTKRDNPETKSNPVELLLINLQFIQQQRIQAEAEAAAALMAVESIPQPMLEIAAGIHTSPHAVTQRCNVADANEGSGKEDEEVESGRSPPTRGASEWADNVLSVDGSESYHEPASETAAEATEEPPHRMQPNLDSATWDTNVPVEVLDSTLGDDDVPASHTSPWNSLPQNPTSYADGIRAACDNVLPLIHTPPPTSPAGRTEGDSDSDSPPAQQSIKKRQRRGTAADPQSLAARARRERIAKKIKVLHELVPGALQLDTASMLEKAIHHVREMEKTLVAAGQIPCSASMIRMSGTTLQLPGIIC